MFEIKNKTSILLIIILVIGAILRFYNIGNLSFTNDELSALSRTFFNDFNSLINEGVKPDGHPALIQVFLYYYTKLVGFNDFLIKLPFILLGISSIYLSYKVASRFFTQTSGIITASYIAVLQFTVMYSQLARPYSSGLFFTLLTVFYWQDFISHNNVKLKSIIGFIIAAILSCYNHYFSFFFIGVISISGLFFLKKQNLFKYLISCFIIVIAFIPHIEITINHLQLGGLNWLGKPDPNFFLHFFGYISNYSWLLGVFLLGVFIAGLVFKPFIKASLKYSILVFIWFITPLAVGYFYSVYFSPVLQFSVLIFSFPYLLMFLSSFIKEQKIFSNIILTSYILIVGIISLIYGREHYKTTYNQPFYDIANNLKIDSKKYGGENISKLFVTNGPFYIEKYLNDFSVDTIHSYYQYGEINIPEVKSIIKLSNSNYFAIGSAIGINSLFLTNIIKEEYKYLIHYTDNYFLFSKNKFEFENGSGIIDTIHHFESDFNNLPMVFNYDENSILFDSIENRKYLNLLELEWGLSFKFLSDTIFSNDNNIISIQMEISSDNPNAKALLVSDIRRKNESIHWSSAQLQDFSSGTNNITNICLNVSLQDIDTDPNDIINILIWNNKKEIIKIYSFKVTILKGKKNPYGIFNDLE